MESSKKSTKLILARKKDDFLYKGSHVTPNFGFENFYYNTLMMNCIYDCAYCYLQGMYQSAHLVLFVNSQDFLDAVDVKREKESPLYVCISYDTDLLALESIIPICTRWIEFVRTRPDLHIEIRSKSANFKAISNVEPTENAVLAWTLSPSEIAKKYERKTPSTEARIKSLSQAVEAGWNVRVCIDPVLKVENWENLYSELVEVLKDQVDLNKVKDFSIGSFRMNHNYFKKTKSINEDVDLFYSDFTKQEELTGYPEEIYSELTEYVVNKLQDVVSIDKIVSI